MPGALQDRDSCFIIIREQTWSPLSGGKEPSPCSTELGRRPGSVPLLLQQLPLMALSSPRASHCFLVPPPRSPGGYDHFLFHYVPRTGLGLVPKEEKWLFRVNQARKGAPTSMGTGLLEPHPRVPRPQEHCKIKHRVSCYFPESLFPPLANRSYNVSSLI